jgi:hypothetical protein
MPLISLDFRFTRFCTPASRPAAETPGRTPERTLFCHLFTMSKSDPVSLQRCKRTIWESEPMLSIADASPGADSAQVPPR